MDNSSIARAIEKNMEFLDCLYDKRTNLIEDLSTDPTNTEISEQLSKVNDLIKYWEDFLCQLQERIGVEEKGVDQQDTVEADMEIDPLADVVRFAEIQYASKHDRRAIIKRVSDKLFVAGALISSDLTHSLFGGTNHSLSGTVTGTNGKFHISIVRAGGVNLKRSHHRITVNKVSG
jgi:hypothetical protein